MFLRVSNGEHLLPQTMLRILAASNYGVCLTLFDDGASPRNIDNLMTMQPFKIDRIAP